MILLSVAKLKILSPESKIFLRIKPKKIKKKFCGKFGSMPTCLEVREKARNVFCDEPTSV